MNPWRSLTQLPWRSLMQAAGLAILSVLVLEGLVPLAAAYVPGIETLLTLLFGGPLSGLVSLAVAVAIGAWAVVCLEWVDAGCITTKSLWGLVLNLTIALVLRTYTFTALLPIPQWLLGLSEVSVVGLILGVFLRGDRYWRYRRW
jgi:hypothetical protein